MHHGGGQSWRAPSTSSCNLRLNAPSSPARSSREISDEPPAKKSRHRPVSSERVHQLDDEGNFAANRRGQPLCV
eukprot:6303826-Amphidinium_carterae.1